MEAPAAQISVNPNKEPQITRVRESQCSSIQRPTANQSSATNNSDGATIAPSRAFGHLSSSGQLTSAQNRKAGVFVTTANLNGHGQTWYLAVLFHPLPNKLAWLSFLFLSHRPQTPKSAAIGT